MRACVKVQDCVRFVFFSKMKKETSSWVKPMQPKAWSDIARNTEPVGTLVYSEERIEKPDPCRQKTHCRFSNV